VFPAQPVNTPEKTPVDDVPADLHQNTGKPIGM
jgi:hypothetical protein